MGTIDISFVGVCTIFRDLPSLVTFPGDLPRNRVVLARTTQEFISHTGVLPHIAKLRFIAGQFEVVRGPKLPPFEPPEPNTFTLDGIQLKILNATGDTTLSPSWGLDCLPSLQAHLYRELGPPAEPVFIQSQEFVQAWFDFQGGFARSYKMRATNDKGQTCEPVPSISVLTIETTDDYADLEYAPFPPGAEPTVVRITPPPAPERSHILLANFALGELFKDDNRDFLLNYTLAQTFPEIADVAIPECNTCTVLSPQSYHTPRCGDAGPGCSNTTYP